MKLSAFHKPGRADLPVGLDAQQRFPTGFIVPVREARIIENHHKGDARSHQCAGFPLTPALSPRERENGPLSVGLTGVLGFVESRDAWLPLPRGEGRGEGNRTHNARRVGIHARSPIGLWQC